MEISVGHKSFWHPYPHIDLMVKDFETGKVLRDKKLKVGGIPIEDDRVMLSVSRSVEGFLKKISRDYDIVDVRDYTGIFPL